MSKKIISLFTLVTFIVFSISCVSNTTSYEKRKVRMAPDSVENRKLVIVAAQTSSGKLIEFSKSYYVRIFLNNIEGYEIKSVPIDKVKNIIKKGGEIFEIETIDGKRYYFLYRKATYDWDKNKLINEYICGDPVVSIPLSEIAFVLVEKLVEVKKISTVKTIVLVTLIGATVAVAVFLAGGVGSLSGFR